MAEAVSRLAVSTRQRARGSAYRTGRDRRNRRGRCVRPQAAVGETPNVAARVQGLAEPGCVVVTERSALLARGLFEYADLGVHLLKG